MGDATAKRQEPDTVTTVVLNDIPGAGTDLEHYVAALYQASGFFVEKNLIERDPGDVLELDVVATQYADSGASSVLVEVKGGGWGYADAFKVLGWKQYLGVDRAAIFVKTGDKTADMKVKLAPFGMDVTCFEDFATAITQFSDEGHGAVADAAVVHLWRHSYDIELRLRTLLTRRARAAPESAAAQAANEYQRLVNDGTFFAKSPLERATMLYEAYKEHPKLTLGAAREADGEPFDPHNAANSPLLSQALLKGEHPFLQACMFNEHRARLAILKAAVDLETLTTDLPHSPATAEILSNQLPDTFHAGRAWLREQSTFHRYAVLWQQFLWGWGGFYLQHQATDEFAWMAGYSGVPVDEIATALTAFDEFFPVNGGWFRTVGPSDLRLVMMVPTYFQGLGAHHRRQEYELADFTAIGGAQYTGSDLTRINNAAVAFLAGPEG